MDKSIDAIEKSIQFQQILKKNPYLITYLVNIACINIIYSNIEHLLNKKKLTEKQLTRLANILAEEPEIQDFIWGIQTGFPFILNKGNELGNSEPVLYFYLPPQK